MDCGRGVRNERSYRFRRAGRRTHTIKYPNAAAGNSSQAAASHARHETLESGSSTLLGLRSRTQKIL
jgi:hypothetical protein